MKQSKTMKRVLASVLAVAMLLGLVGPVKKAQAEGAVEVSQITVSSAAISLTKFATQLNFTTPETSGANGTYGSSASTASTPGTITINGTPQTLGAAVDFAGYSTGSYRLDFWVQMAVNDVVVIEGTFEWSGAQVTFPRTEFTIQGDETNGYYWTSDRDAIRVQVTDVSLIDASKTAGAGNNLRVKFTTGTAFPKTETTFQRGDSAVLNHNGVWMNAYLHAYEGNGYYQLLMDWADPLVKAGDEVTIAGTFQNADGSFTITFPETSFVCRGDATTGYYWKLKSEPDVLQADELVLTNTSKEASSGNYKRIQFTTGTMVPDEHTVFNAGAGAVLTRNGEGMDAYLYGHPDIPYYQIVMDDAVPATTAGDIITIAGTFSNSTETFSITFLETSFKCVGDAANGYYWQLESTLNVLESGSVGVATESATLGTDTKRIVLDTEASAPTKATYFIPSSDGGILRNGQWVDAYLYSFENGPYVIVTDDAVPATTVWDVITISGTFLATDGKWSIRFPETHFECIGDETSGYCWQLAGVTGAIDSGKVELDVSSSTVGASPKKVFLKTEAPAPKQITYFEQGTDAVLLRNGQWVDAYLYSYENGPYTIVTDDAIPATAVGDVITIGGTFVSRDEKWPIVFPTMSFRCMQDDSSGCYWVLDYGTKATTLSQEQSRDMDFQFTSPDTQEIPVDGAKLRALNELDSGIYVNGEKISGTLAKIDTTSFELDLKSYAAQDGDIVTVQGGFATEKYVVSFQHFSAQYKQGVWSIVDTASGKVIMPDTVVDLEQISAGYVIEEGSAVTTDKGAALTEEVIQKPGNYIFSRVFGNIQYAKNIVVYRKGDVHIDDILDVKDLIAMLKVQKDASNYGEAEEMASEVLEERTTGENRKALRNMLVNNGMYVPEGAPTYADDIYIELAAFCGPRRAGYRIWNGSEGGHPEDPEGGWDSFFTEKNFQDYIDAGFTYLMAEGDANYSSDFEGSTLQAYMELAEKMNIPVLVASGSVISMASGTSHQLTQANKDYLVQLLKDLSVYKSLKGLTLRDEPGIANVKAFDSIQDYIWERDPDFFFYTCMLPIYAAISSFSETETENKDVAYQEYVGSFANATKTFAYDHYPLYTHPYNGNTVKSDYYHNFELVAQDAKRGAYDAGIVVQSSSWGNKDGELTTAHPRKTNTKADIGFQVYSALAYGMKYINYYTYWEHWSQSDSSYVYDAMVLYPENKGEEPIKTDTYYAVQAVNQEIKKFDHIFMRYDWQGSMAVVPSNASKSALLSGVNDYQSPRIGEITATQETLIGCMKDENGYDGFWIVNATEPSEKRTDSVTIEFKQASSAICYIEGEEQRIELQDGKYTFNLGAGEGIFVIPVQ